MIFIAYVFLKHSWVSSPVLSSAKQNGLYSVHPCLNQVISIKKRKENTLIDSHVFLRRSVSYSPFCLSLKVSFKYRIENFRSQLRKTVPRKSALGARRKENNSMPCMKLVKLYMREMQVVYCKLNR